MHNTTRKHEHGYSLIEMLVVITLFVIISVAAVTLFLSTVLGHDRTASGITLKQNGDYAIGVMSYMIRNSLRVTACNSGANGSISIVSRDNASTTFSMAPNGALASNSAVMTTSQIRVNPSDPGDTGLAALSTGLGFTCYPALPTEPTTVTIRFILRKGTYGLENTRDIVTQVFETTVGLRRY